MNALGIATGIVLILTGCGTIVSTVLNWREKAHKIKAVQIWEYKPRGRTDVFVYYVTRVQGDGTVIFTDKDGFVSAYGPNYFKLDATLIKDAPTP